MFPPFKNNPSLNTIWKASSLLGARKSKAKSQFERLIHHVSTSALCNELSNQSHRLSLPMMSHMLLGIVRIAHHQNMNLYERSLRLVNKLQRELAQVSVKSIENPAAQEVPVLTLAENPYFFLEAVNQEYTLHNPVHMSIVPDLITLEEHDQIDHYAMMDVPASNSPPIQQVEMNQVQQASSPPPAIPIPKPSFHQRLLQQHLQGDIVYSSHENEDRLFMERYLMEQDQAQLDRLLTWAENVAANFTMQEASMSATAAVAQSSTSAVPSSSLHLRQFNQGIRHDVPVVPVTNSQPDYNLENDETWQSLFVDFDLAHLTTDDDQRSSMISDPPQLVPIMTSLDRPQPSSHQYHHRLLFPVIENPMQVEPLHEDISIFDLPPPYTGSPTPFRNMSPVIGNDNQRQEQQQQQPLYRNSPASSTLLTADYSNLSNASLSPTLPPLANARDTQLYPRYPRYRYGRLVNQEPTSLPLSTYTDTSGIINAHPAVNTPMNHGGNDGDDGTSDARANVRNRIARVVGLRQLETIFRQRMQQSSIAANVPPLSMDLLWREPDFGILDEQQDGALREMEYGRLFEQGRNQDPHTHTHDDFSYSDDQEGEMDTAALGVPPATINYGGSHMSAGSPLLQMELEDDHRSNITNSTSFRQRIQQGSNAVLQQGHRHREERQQEQQDEARHDYHDISASTNQQDGLEPNYADLEMGVEMQPPDSSSSGNAEEFYAYVQLFTNNHHRTCTFQDLFIPNAEGSKKSEVALAFNHLLALSSESNRILPEQTTPYGPITLHLFNNQDNDDNDNDDDDDDIDLYS